MISADGNQEQEIFGDRRQTFFSWVRGGGGWGAGVLALFLGLAPLAYRRDLQDLYTLPKRALFTVAGLAGAALLLALYALRRRTLGLPAEALGALLFLGAASTSLARSISPSEGVDLMRDLLQLLAWWAVGVMLVRTPARLGAVLAGVLAAGTLTATIGLLQWLQLDVWPWAPGPRPEGRLFEKLPVVDAPGSVFGHVNMASEVAAAGFLAGLALLGGAVRCLFRKEGGGGSGGAGGRVFGAGHVLLAGGAGLAALGAAVSGFFLVVGSSRAAWLGAAAGSAWLLGVWLAAARRAPWRGRAFAAAGMLVAGVVALFVLLDQRVAVPGRGGGPPQRPSERLAELFSWKDGTERERIVLWKNTVEMIQDQPVLGVGPGNWKIVWPVWSRSAEALDPERFSLSRQPEGAHMDALQLVAETGLVGFGLMVLFLGPAVVRLARGRSSAAGPALRHGAVAVVVGVMAMSLGAYTLQNPVPSAFAFLLLGCGAGVERPAKPRKLWLSPPVLAGAAVLAAVVLVVAASSLWGRLVANQESWFARHLQLAARTAVEDRGASPRPARLLLEEARDRLDRAATREPGNYRYQAQRALVLWDLGLGDAAQAVFDRVLTLHPNLVNALLLKSLLLLQAVDEGGGRPYAAAYDLLGRALAIQPESAELRYALAQLLDRFADEGGDPQSLARTEAAHQYRVAVRQREYMPLARLALARLLLENGGPLSEVQALLAKAEENAALEPERLADCARLYAHPRLAIAGGDLFGPAGQKTLAVWQRVLGLTREEFPEAVLEVHLAPLNRALAGGPAPGRESLASMLAITEDILAGEPKSLLARYYRANLLERLERDGEALVEWGNLIRAGQEGRRPSARLREMMDRAVEASVRLRERVDAPGPGVRKP